MKQNCIAGRKFLLFHTILLGIVASIAHFAYEISGNSVFVGLFTPINESVWEHLKLMFFPNLIWWILMYFIQNKKCNINLNNWIFASATSLIMAPLLVTLLFYAFTGALGIESLLFDISLVFICYYIALAFAFHMYKYAKPNRLLMIIMLLAVVLLFLSFLIFTFYPPQFPIFLDTSAGT